MNVYKKNDILRAGETAQQLIAIATFAHDLDVVPSTHTAAHNYQQLQLQRIQNSLLVGTRCVHQSQNIPMK